MAQSRQTMEFMVMTDEHVANVIWQQLSEKEVNVVRLIDILPTGTPDPQVLEYCHQYGYALITLDEPMRGHIKSRTQIGKEHAGVFLGNRRMQGSKGIGTIVNFMP